MGCEASRSSRQHGDAEPAPTRRCDRHAEGCGHRCGGVRGEAGRRGGHCGERCIGCVEEGCGAAAGDCPVCLDPLSAAPSVRLDCGHAAHYSCAAELLARVDWRGKQVTPAQLRCPAGCGAAVAHPLLRDRAAPLVAVAARAAADARKRAAAEGLPADVAEAKWVYFQCYSCRKPFCGGLHECMAAGDEDEAPAPDPSTILCGQCVKKPAKCKHGNKYMTPKCDWCCQPATFECGCGFYCTPCHDHHGELKSGKMVRAKCDPKTCPFAGVHPNEEPKGDNRRRSNRWYSKCLKCNPTDGWLCRSAVAELPPPLHTPTATAAAH